MNPETRKSLTESIKQEILDDLRFQCGARTYGDNGNRPYGLKSTRQAYHDLAEAIWQDVLSGIGSIEGFIERKIGRRDPSRLDAGAGPDRRLNPAERERIKKDVLNELQFAIPGKSGPDYYNAAHEYRALAESIKQEILADMEAQREAREEAVEKESRGREQQREGTYGGSYGKSQSLTRAEMERIKRDVLHDLQMQPESNF